jgi:methylmalonyl-CoA/ethylmalonyl-CoA epimerase
MSAEAISTEFVTSCWKFHHLGIAVNEIQTALRIYNNLFGYRLLSGPFNDPLQAASVCFVGSDLGVNPVLELIAPLGNDSHVHSIIQKGAGAYHLCYEVPDLEQSIAAARIKGCIVVRNPAPAVAFDGRRVAWLYTPTRHLLEILEA